MKNLMLTLLAAAIFIGCQSDPNNPMPNGSGTNDSTIVTDISGTYPVTVSFSENQSPPEEPPQNFDTSFPGNLTIYKISDSVVGVALTSDYDNPITDSVKFIQSTSDTSFYEKTDMPNTPLGTTLKFNTTNNKLWLRFFKQYYVRVATNE